MRRNEVEKQLNELGDTYLESLLKELNPIGIVVVMDLRNMILKEEIVLTGDLKKDATSELRYAITNMSMRFDDEELDYSF